MVKRWGCSYSHGVLRGLCAPHAWYDAVAVQTLHCAVAHVGDVVKHPSVVRMVAASHAVRVELSACVSPEGRIERSKMFSTWS